MIILSLYYLSFFVLFWVNRDSNQKSNIKYGQIILSFTLLFVFFGFRDITVLNDTPHYYAPVRDKMAMGASLGWFDINVFSRFESGYQIFENFVAKLFSNPFAIIIVSSLIITLANISFFRKTKNGLFLCLFLMLNYQLILQYSAIRQGLAAAMSYYGFSNYFKGNIKTFIVSVLLASSFHITAILLLLIIPISRMKLNKKTVVISVIVFFVIISYFLEPLIALFSTDDQSLVSTK